MDKKIPVYKEGDIRTQQRFLWFPKTIGGRTRWFERATWEQKFDSDPEYSPWQDVKWLD